MESKVLEKKSVIKDEFKTGDSEMTFLDLTSSFIDYEKVADRPINVVDSVMVDETMEMRPDLIVFQSTLNTDNWDLICKFNGISNPFSIEQGTYLFIPDVNYMETTIVSTMESPKDKQRKRIKDQYCDKSKKPEMESKKRNDYLSRVKEKLAGIDGSRIVKNPLPPNFQRENATQIKPMSDGISLGESRF